MEEEMMVVKSYAISFPFPKSVIVLFFLLSFLVCSIFWWLFWIMCVRQMFNNHSLLKKIITWTWFVSQSYFHDVIVLPWSISSSQQEHTTLFGSLGLSQDEVADKYFLRFWEFIVTCQRLTQNCKKASVLLLMAWGTPCRQQLCPAEQHSPWAEATQKAIRRTVEQKTWFGSPEKHRELRWFPEMPAIEGRHCEAYESRLRLRQYIYHIHFESTDCWGKATPLQLITHNWETITKM